MTQQQANALRVSGDMPKTSPERKKTMTRPLTEKQARMRTIAALMSTLEYLNIVARNEMDNFSFEEVQSFHDGVELLDHFVKIASVQT